LSAEEGEHQEPAKARKHALRLTAGGRRFFADAYVGDDKDAKAEGYR
jgi:hypothetical protein